MKIILSRKGFDSGNAQMPSPILEDGTLLSMPIPVDDEKYGKQTFGQLQYQGKTYDQIIHELKPKSDMQANTHCHLDPDLRKDALPGRENWQAVFGQCETALTHLKDKGVEKGDLFLFFGWFRHTEKRKDGTLKFVGDDLHVLYAYMQISEIYSTANNLPGNLKDHPHYDKIMNGSQTDVIYTATDDLTVFDSLKGYPGSDCFKFADPLVLTKKGLSRSRWDLPEFFRHAKISYHTENSWKNEGYFQSACRGQEFVIDLDRSSTRNEILDWTKNIIQVGCQKK